MSFLTGPMHKHLDGKKELTAHNEPVRVATPDVIYIPLANGRADLTPCVEVGDEVKIGSKIAERNDHFYLPIYSPVSGKVTGIEKKMCGNLVMKDHLVITNDHKDDEIRPFEPMNYETASDEELLEFIKNSGMLGLGGAGFPSYVKYLKPENIDLFIVNAVECEPFLTSDYHNCMDHLELLKEGTLALFKLSKAKKGCIAIKENKKDLIDELNKTFANTPIEVRTVKDIYPAGWERTLIYLLTGKRYDRLPAEAGCVVNNSSTAIAFGNALVNGKAIKEKYVTVSGDGIKEPTCCIVTVGTPAEKVLAECGGLVSQDVVVCYGGPMMGKTMTNDQFVIGFENNGLTCLKKREEFSVKCLRCGKCTEVCPSGLQPVRINMCNKAQNVDELMKLDVNSCIECGLCTYICPSKLDVTEGIRRAKRYIALKKK